MSYSQEIYDATRSKIHNGDIGAAVESVARDAFDFSWVKASAQQAIGYVGDEMARPSVLFRPRIMLDGTAWCALYGEDLMNGVAGFGDTPDQAMREFDAAWQKQKTPAAMRAQQGAKP